MEHSRNGPTSHPLQGTVTAAQRTQARTRTARHSGGSPRTHADPPCARRHPPRSRAASRSGPPRSSPLANPGALPCPALPSPLGGPGCPLPSPLPPPLPPLGAPPPQGARGRGESPVGAAPPRAPLPGGDHAHSPPQEGITQGSLRLICIHLQAGYSPHFLTACHRQRPVPGPGRLLCRLSGAAGWADPGRGKGLRPRCPGDGAGDYQRPEPPPQR
ncbi:uncharacterized protein [Heliangelus exortis]|uniref:uncharacterized protein n=1 Tax=Heliangelus exortis TaxID=472823 RepID=UPI003A93BA1F